MKHESFSNYDKIQIAELLKSKDSLEIISTIIGAVNEIDDWKWLQDQILVLVNHKDFWVAKTAINSIGDIARIHKKLDVQLVIDKVKTNQRKDLIAVIDECIEDITLFLG